MKKLKEQISNIIVFKVSNMEELYSAYTTIENRLRDGYERMADSYFNESEIKEIKEYGDNMLYQRYTEALRGLRCMCRDNFQF